MAGKTAALRRLLAEEAFIQMPVAYDALGGRLIEKTGFKAAYVGGFVTGGSRCTSEPLLTLDEQARVAGDVARAVTIPVLADAGAGFGEPLHTMRTVRESLSSGRLARMNPLCCCNRSAAIWMVRVTSRFYPRERCPIRFAAGCG